MHVAWAANLIVTGVIIAMTFFFRARSLLPLAPVRITGTRHVHAWHHASRSTPHPFAYD
ncbi:hypothetical protein [Paraburkholderia jirisanensis]|jgi:hypothetical protein